jgi:hypothetical protein
MSLVVDGARMAALLRGPTGPVTRHLIERATVVQMAAKAQAPRRTGCLQDSIVKRVEETPLGTIVRIVADTTPCSPERISYAYYVHEGTPPHTIQAKNAGVLAFFWENGPDGPGTYFFREVHHPGTAPNRFLTDNLPLAVA